MKGKQLIRGLGLFGDHLSH